MADITPDHIFLREFLLPVLLCTVVVIMMHHSPTAVVSQLRGGYRGTLQIAPQVFDAAPGPPGFLREVDFPVTPVLGLQIASPLSFIADVAQTRQAAGSDTVVAFAQQTNDRPAPDFLHLLLPEKQGAPYIIFDIEATPGHGDMDVGMLIELAAVSMQRTKDADLNTLFAGPPEHGTGGRAEEVIEQGPVVTEKGPEDVGHRKGNMLPVAVGEDVLLCGNPLLGRFHAAGATGLRLAALAEEAGVGAVG